jgi:hypothetical protein
MPASDGRLRPKMSTRAGSTLYSSIGSLTLTSSPEGMVISTIWRGEAPACSPTHAGVWCTVDTAKPSDSLA